MTTGTRLYAPGYFGPEGDLRVIGQETAWLPGAIAEMTKLEEESEPGDAELFVAYRDVPAWQPLPIDALSETPAPRSDSVEYGGSVHGFGVLQTGSQIYSASPHRSNCCC